MRYLTLLYDDETTMPEPGTPEFDLDLAGYAAFDAVARDSIVAGEALEPSSMARTVRHDGDQVRVTAGPFAETTEVLGGWFVLEADTLDDAIELARQIPAVLTGGIELRPVVEWIDAAADAPDGAPRCWCTIHGPETSADDPDGAEWDAGAQEHARFGELAGSALRAAGAVHPTSSATTIRVRDGELLVSDGPYAEATEIVGGVYLLAGTPEQVEALAARIPVNPGGAVEIRPIMEIDG